MLVQKKVIFLLTKLIMIRYTLIARNFNGYLYIKTIIWFITMWY